MSQSKVYVPAGTKAARRGTAAKGTGSASSPSWTSLTPQQINVRLDQARWNAALTQKHSHKPLFKKKA